MLCARSLRAAVALAVSILALLATIAFATPSQAAPSLGPGISYKTWKITSHGKSYTSGSAWHNCAAFTKRSYSYVLGCNFSESVGNTVSGTVSVSYKVLSVSVGYSVTKTETVGANASFTIAKNTAGHIQYHQTYEVTPVHQTEYQCVKWADGRPTTCSKIGTATAYPHKWAGTEFRRA